MKDRYKIIILGAGIGGLATAAELKAKGEEDFLIVDAAPSLPENLGNGVHYLHDDELGLPFQIGLKEIPHTEELWSPATDQFFQQANIPQLMEYSLKVMETRYPGSIYGLGRRDWKTVVPTSNDMNDLLRHYVDYIGADKFVFGRRFTSLQTGNRVATFEPTAGGERRHVGYQRLVSTTPLPLFLGQCGVDVKVDFVHRPIYITNYRAKAIAPDWLVLVYVSDPKFAPFRITMLNNVVSMESMTEMVAEQEVLVNHYLGKHFDYDLATSTKFTWKLGRVRGLDKATREGVAETLKRMGLHLVGRYGNWDQSMEMVGTIRQAKGVAEEVLL